MTVMLRVAGECHGSPVTTSIADWPGWRARNRTALGGPIGARTRPSVPRTLSTKIPRISTRNRLPGARDDTTKGGNYQQGRLGELTVDAPWKEP